MVKAFVFDAYGTLYDVHSVSEITDASFPGHADYITQIWRMKQLEYSWLRSLMGRYQDFWTVTRESLDYSLRTWVFAPIRNCSTMSEPPRVFRRPLHLSHAAMAGSSSMA
ncbi:HAD-IA family hydrolase [Mesorhizobium sp. B2-2-4]|nr:HAD-IA family hydrolase [Mesorhizobium sp. B2-2-4]TPM65687.1 HAD-IA family hydrolase [Mesorhizobium sp. B2-2-1]TPN38403.1 HAD-IA family hydrolase [Mesorhizobium sp. B1-1-6]TPN72012.1 HAD-IA family hydrolase [Mesorhizobium sp. B1-1-3]